MREGNAGIVNHLPQQVVVGPGQIFDVWDLGIDQLRFAACASGFAADLGRWIRTFGS
jgi:hypothetical protein